MTARIIWGALLAGPVIFGGIVFYLVQEGLFDSGGGPTLRWALFAAAFGLLITGVPIGLMIRGKMYQRDMRDGVVDPEVYLPGNIIVWAFTEGAAFMALVGCMIDASLIPNIIPAGFAALLHLVFWPDGKVMKPEDADNPYRR